MFLDRVFSNKSRILILRELSVSSEGLTNSEIAEKTGLSEMAVSRNIHKLAGEGLVNSRRVGNALVSELNEKNNVGFLLKYLFKWECESSKELRKIVKDSLTGERGDIECIVVFGSRARGDERLDSDLDVLVLKSAGEPKTDTRLVKGVMASLFELPVEEFITRIKSNDPLALNVVFEGDVIHGEGKFEKILKKAGL